MFLTTTGCPTTLDTRKIWLCPEMCGKSISPILDTQKNGYAKKGKTLSAELDTTIFVKTTQISYSGQWQKKLTPKMLSRPVWDLIFFEVSSFGT